MPQHTSSEFEVTIEYSTTRFKAKEKGRNLIKAIVKKLIINRPIKVCCKIYKKTNKEKVSRYPHFLFKKVLNP